MDLRRGQVGIIMLLVTVVMLTVGISAATRTVSDVRNSRVSEDANRALDAAESGIEEALSQDLTSFSGGTAGTTADIDVNTSVQRLTTLDAFVEQGDAASISTSGARNGQTLTINWAKERNCNDQASLIITVYNGSGASATARRYFQGTRTGCGGRNAQDGFSNSRNGTISGYNLSTTIQMQTGDVLVRIRPVYANTDLRVTAPWLQPQMFKVRATAQSETNRETKAVEVDRSLPVAPSIFDYVIYSGTGITQ